MKIRDVLDAAKKIALKNKHGRSNVSLKEIVVKWASDPKDADNDYGDHATILRELKTSLNNKASELFEAEYLESFRKKEKQTLAMSQQQYFNFDE